MARNPLALAVKSLAVIVCLASIAACTVPVSQPARASVLTAPPAATAAKQYYLALGDSLADGAQPNHQGGTVPTGQGYPNQLDALLAKHGRDLVLDDLGCIGESTWSLIHGSVCSYPGESGGGAQLRAALDFLRAHAGHVPLITLNIGINDLSPCTPDTNASMVDSCAQPLIAGIRSNTIALLKALHKADPSAVIVGLDYYVPELAYWLNGSEGQAYAEVMQSMFKSMNAVLAADYKAAGARYADVFTAFKSGDLTDMTTLPGYGSVPVGVARICQWTWMCAAPPKNLNEHANKTGYGVMAQTVYAALPAAAR